MSRLRSLSIVLVGALIFACAEDRPPPAPPPVLDAGEDTAMDAAADMGAPDVPPVPDAGAVCDDPLGPTVEVLAPDPAVDPNLDPIVTSTSLTIVCRAIASTEPGGRAVDPLSVVISVLDPAGAVLSTPMVLPGSVADTYEAIVDVTPLQSGTISVRCTAEDVELVAHCGMAEISTFLDRGPAIEISSPMADSVHSSLLAISYRLTATPVDPTDLQADVAGHDLIVAGRTIAAVGETAPGEYLASIDLDDRSVFPDPLDGPRSFTIRAWNSRVPDPVERTATQDFTVDATGPSISITSPAEGVFVNGLVAVTADITDVSGVDVSTVSLIVGAMNLPMTPMGATGFARTFDASGFGRTIGELTLNITAADIVGNGSAASRLVKLDSTPPFIDLDPPMVRDVLGVNCSTLFDPVGSDSAVDGEVLGTAAEFRVRVEDIGNSSFGGGGTAVFLAGLDPMTVDVYILDNVATPLLVDLNADGVCDDINPAVLPGAGGPDTAVVLELVAIPPTGRAFYPPIDFTMAAPIYSDCTSGPDTIPGAALCGTTPLSRVIAADLLSSVSAIYAKPPVVAVTCAGDAWDFQASVSEGWACVAGRAEDNLGNVGLSFALRSCFTDGAGPDPCPLPVGGIVAAAMRPSCTDGCIPPPSFASQPTRQLICPTGGCM